jgi:hypothetical protein
MLTKVLRIQPEGHVLVRAPAIVTPIRRI